MPISPHLLRRLQESLGVDAAADLAMIVETVDAMRADLAELRHEVRREIDGVKARVEATATKADIQTLRTDIQTVRTENQALRAEFKDALLFQTRWMLAGVVTVLLAIFFKS